MDKISNHFPFRPEQTHLQTGRKVSANTGGKRRKTEDAVRVVKGRVSRLEEQQQHFDVRGGKYAGTRAGEG